MVSSYGRLVAHLVGNTVSVGEGHLDVVETKRYGNILNDITRV